MFDGLGDAGATATSSSTGAQTSSSTSGAGGSGGSCDSSLHTMNAADFSTTCGLPSDCMNAFLGDFCQGCSCPFWAINVADQAKYEAEVAMKAAGAPPSICGCPAMPVDCIDGMCMTHTP